VLGTLQALTIAASARVDLPTTTVDWQAIAAVGASVAALVAAVGLILEGRRDRRSIGIQNLWKLIEQWDSPESRLRRARLAQHLRGDLDRRSGELSGQAIDVLDTFELVGYLVSARAVRLRDAWALFYPFALSWWGALAPALKEERARNKLVYQDFHRLVRRLAAYEARRQNPPWRRPAVEWRLRKLDLTDARSYPREQVIGFLSEEIGLLTRLPPGFLGEEVRPARAHPVRRRPA
jgi:hypothetical protein